MLYKVENGLFFNVSWTNILISIFLTLLIYLHNHLVTYITDKWNVSHFLYTMNEFRV